MLVSARGWRGRERKGAEKEKEQRKKRNKTASHKSSLGIPASHFKGPCSLSRMEWAKVNHHMTFPMAGKPNCQNYTPQTVYGHIWVQPVIAKKNDKNRMDKKFWPFGFPGIYIYIHIQLYTYIYIYVYNCMCIYIYIPGKPNGQNFLSIRFLSFFLAITGCTQICPYTV